MQLKFEKVLNVKFPVIATNGSAGIDFFIPEKDPDDEAESIIIWPNEDRLVRSGLKVKMPLNTTLIAFNKSGIATNKKLIVGAEVIDADYQGELHFHIINFSKKPQIINFGQKIMQFILFEIPKVELVEEKNIHDEETQRGSNGFGSTGI